MGISRADGGPKPDRVSSPVGQQHHNRPLLQMATADNSRLCLTLRFLHNLQRYTFGHRRYTWDAEVAFLNASTNELKRAGDLRYGVMCTFRSRQPWCCVLAEERDGCGKWTHTCSEVLMWRRQVRPAHADVPNRKSVLTNVSPVEGLLTRPGRAKRPKLIAVVIRGLPGSGKSFIARRLRDAEVEAGGSGPRIHCIDDYFVTARIPFMDPCIACVHHTMPTSTKYTLLEASSTPV